VSCVVNEIIYVALNDFQLIFLSSSTGTVAIEIVWSTSECHPLSSFSYQIVAFLSNCHFVNKMDRLASTRISASGLVEILASQGKTFF